MTPPSSVPGVLAPDGADPGPVRRPASVGRHRSEGSGGWARAAALLELTKPGITGYVLLTAAAGYLLAGGAAGDLPRLAWLLAGTALAAGGTNALNQVLERDRDARMGRTRGRPLPAGTLTPAEGLAFSLLIAAGGVGLLIAGVNLLTGLLAAATLAGYAFVYTPLKPRSALSTPAGAVPGALPILGGWTAAAGTVDPGGLALFAILFLWQMPHFLGLGWLLREDYRRGGFRILAVDDPSGRRTGRHSLAWLLLLVPAVHLPLATGTVAGGVYVWGSLALTFAYLVPGVLMALRPGRRSARGLFLASVAYLPTLLALLVLARNR